MFKEFYCSEEEKDFSYELFKYFFVPLILFIFTISVTGLSIIIPIRTLNYLYIDYKKSELNPIKYFINYISLIFICGVIFFTIFICIEYFAFDNLNNGFIKKFIDLILKLCIKIEKNYDNISRYCSDKILNMIN